MTDQPTEQPTEQDLDAVMAEHAKRDGICKICGVRWPCGPWVTARETWDSLDALPTPSRADLGLPEHYPSVGGTGVNPDTDGPLYVGQCACRWMGERRTTEQVAWQDAHRHVAEEAPPFRCYTCGVKVWDLVEHGRQHHSDHTGEHQPPQEAR